MLKICWRFCSFSAPLLICRVWTLIIWNFSINVPSPPPSFINLESSRFMVIFRCKKACWFTNSFSQGTGPRKYLTTTHQYQSNFERSDIASSIVMKFLAATPFSVIIGVIELLEESLISSLSTWGKV